MEKIKVFKSYLRRHKMQIEIPTRLSGRIKESLARDLVKALPTATEAMIREIPLWLLEDMLFCSIQMKKDKETSFLMEEIRKNLLAQQRAEKAEQRAREAQQRAREAQQKAREAKKLREDIEKFVTSIEKKYNLVKAI